MSNVQRINAPTLNTNLTSYGDSIGDFLKTTRDKLQAEKDNKLQQDKLKLSQGLYKVQQTEFDNQLKYFKNDDGSFNTARFKDYLDNPTAFGQQISAKQYEDGTKPDEVVEKPRTGSNGNQFIDTYTNSKYTGSKQISTKELEPKKAKPNMFAKYDSSGNKYYEDKIGNRYDLNLTPITKMPKEIVEEKTKDINEVLGKDNGAMKNVMQNIYSEINNGIFSHDIKSEQFIEIMPQIMEDLKKIPQDQLILLKDNPKALIRRMYGGESGFANKYGLKTDTLGAIVPNFLGGNSGYTADNKLQSKRLAENSLYGNGINEDESKILKNTGIYTDSELEKNSVNNKSSLQQTLSSYLKTKPGFEDGKFDRYSNGVMQNINGLQGTYEKTFGNPDMATILEQRNEKLDERSNNYSIANNSTDVAGIVADISKYAPELLIPGSKAIKPLYRALSDGAKFGTAGYAIDKVYGQSEGEAQMNGIANGVIAGVIPFAPHIAKFFTEQSIRGSKKAQEIAKKVLSSQKSK